ncbi:MAG TPA: hypothetical protein VFA35_11850 [Burkholderiaceae bacterium]|nr:hypothetical protein [Burkholderiaceae bacterium]
MHDPHDGGRTARRRRTGQLFLLGLLTWVACSSLVPRHGWDKSLGPVVPHDTFPDDCSLCHTGSDWHTLHADFAFDHRARTGVPLLGAHATATCLSCHNDRGPAGRFAAQGCGGCHQDPHRGELGRGCKDCHEERTWQPSAMIQRHDRTRFPLVGAHAATACFRCHAGAQVGNFAGASTRCEDCHAGEYTRSTFDHVAAGFTSDCQHCHRPVGWKPAQFSHPASFPLTLGHANRACSACHLPNTYSGLSRVCSSCHLDDYQRTTNPPHAAYAMPTTCEQCHNTRTWGSGTFVHSWFPITSGAHRGFACVQCHTTQVGPVFSCTSCHTHAQSPMASTHSGVRGYSWVSSECYRCHPNGRR